MVDHHEMACTGALEKVDSVVRRRAPVRRNHCLLGVGRRVVVGREARTPRLPPRGCRTSARPRPGRPLTGRGHHPRPATLCLRPRTAGSRPDPPTPSGSAAATSTGSATPYPILGRPVPRRPARAGTATSGSGRPLAAKNGSLCRAYAVVLAGRQLPGPNTPTTGVPTVEYSRGLAEPISGSRASLHRERAGPWSSPESSGPSSSRLPRSFWWESAL